MSRSLYFFSGQGSPILDAAALMRVLKSQAHCINFSLGSDLSDSVTSRDIQVEPTKRSLIARRLLQETGETLYVVSSTFA